MEFRQTSVWEIIEAHLREYKRRYSTLASRDLRLDMVAFKKQQAAAKAWKEAHPEQYRALRRNAQARYRAKNRERLRQKSLDAYARKYSAERKLARAARKRP